MNPKTTVVLDANATGLGAGLRKSLAELQAFQGSAQGISKSIGSTFASLGAGISVAAISSSVKSMINLADETAKMSQRLGISTLELGAWSLAADLSGASVDSVARGVKGLATYMVQYGDRLKKAGIDTSDTSRAMIQLADVFKVMPDGLKKTALATQIFGKAGIDMIPMLNLGSKGLAEIRDKADGFATRLAELAPDAERFNDQLTEMQFQAKLVGINLASVATGPMADWLTAQNEAIRIAGGFSESLRLFVFNLDAMTTEKPVEEIKRLTKALEDYQAAGSGGKFAQSPTGFLFGGREEDLKKQIEFLKFLQRQQVMADAKKLGDYRDARDLSALNKGSAAAEALANGLLVTPAAKKGDKSKGIIGPDDIMDLVRESVAKQNRAGFDERDVADSKAAADSINRLNGLLASTPSGQLAKAREEMQFLAAALEKGAIAEEQFTELVGVHYGKATDALDEMSQFAVEAARNMQDAMAAGFFDIMQGKFDNLGDSFKATLDHMVANAMAAKLGSYLFGDFGSKGGDFGGVLGDLVKGFIGGGGYGDIAGVAAGVPQFAMGTDYVPRTGLALIHQGERIIPAAQNKAGAGMTNVFNFTLSTPTDRRTQEQVAAMAGAGIQRAMARNN